jgi:hypothetical protein
MNAVANIQKTNPIKPNYHLPFTIHQLLGFGRWCKGKIGVVSGSIGVVSGGNGGILGEIGGFSGGKRGEIGGKKGKKEQKIRSSESLTN